jgi:signal transduction histidine kinase
VWRTLLPTKTLVTGHDYRTVIYTPTGKDGRLIAALLERLEMDCHVAGSMEAACESIREGAGAAIVSEEAFAGDSIGPLREVLRSQPQWSDFPVILLTVSGRVTAESERLRKLRDPLGNIFLLERPIRPETLLSTLEIALRGRQRQYQIRDQMQQYAVAQKALLRSEKLAVTGRLAASIAHEINNPLAAITNLLYLMRGDNSPEMMHALLSDAEQELARVTEITKQTLRFYREPAQPVATEVAAVLDSVVKLYRSRLTAAGVKVQREIRAEGAMVLSSPGELRQVVANLIGNAIDAMKRGGRLRVRVSEHRRLDADRGYVRVTIADTGTGIPAEVLPGLWVTAEIMKKNGWKIRVRSCRSGRQTGTAFCIVIPMLEFI